MKLKNVQSKNTDLNNPSNFLRDEGKKNIGKPHAIGATEVMLQFSFQIDKHFRGDGSFWYFNFKSNTGD